MPRGAARADPRELLRPLSAAALALLAAAACDPSGPDESAGWVVTGRVLFRGEEGETSPELGAHVAIEPDLERTPSGVRPAEPWSAVVGEGGLFRSPAFPAGAAISLRIEGEDAARRTFSIDLPCFPETGCVDLGEIELHPGFALAVELLDESGRAVPGATIVLERDSEYRLRDLQPFERSGVPERAPKEVGRGRYAFDGLSPGVYVLHAWARESVWFEPAVEVPRSSPLALDPWEASRASGRVLAVDGTPIPDAEVRILGFPRETKTDGAGRFAFAVGLSRVDSFGVLEARADGYAGAVWAGEIGEGEIEFRLLRASSLSGVVLSGEDGRPLRGARVFLAETCGCLFSDLCRTWSAATDAEGRFEIAQVPPGDHELSTACPGHLPMEAVPVTLPIGGRLEGLELRLSPEPEAGVAEGSDPVFPPETGRPISGRVAGPFGEPVPWALVRVEEYAERGRRDWMPWHGGGTVADRSARFALEVPPGAERIALAARREGYAPGRIEIAAPPAPEPLDPVEIRLGPDSAAPGDMVDPEERGAAFALVDGHPARGIVRGWCRATGAVLALRGAVEVGSLGQDCGRTRPIQPSGFFQFPAPSGDLWILASVDGYALSWSEVSLGEGDGTEIVLPLEPGGAIEGRVVCARSGEPLRSARVRAAEIRGRKPPRPEPMEFWDLTGDEGEFFLGRLPAGPIRLEASAEGRRDGEAIAFVLAEETAYVAIALEEEAAAPPGGG